MTSVLKVCAGVLFLSAVLPGPATTVAQTTFTNPAFKSQDPWVVQWNGNYYYSESQNGAIKIRKSPTLTGLSKATGQTVWTNTGTSGSGLTNVWAPEIHFIDGRWYIYFSADHRDDNHQQLHVIEGGANPLDRYSPGGTGAAQGLLSDSTGLWAIDPDIFTGADGSLYLTWSCTDNINGYSPQYICLAGMSDPLHFSSAAVRISRPDTPWETRTAPIQEGPVGFVRNGMTYITYSASASWTPDDYAVGLLTNANGNLLDASSWAKTGPIFDRHGTAYGPGSVVFVTSPDGTETWSVYHAYDQLDCAAWTCRSIRLQKIAWGADGLPLLGYPVNPEVMMAAPSGDAGSRTGWGDSQNGALSSGYWTYSGASTLESTGAAFGASFARSFRAGSSTPAWTVSAEVKMVSQPGDGGTAEYGVIALFQDDGNQVQAFIDAAGNAICARAIVGGLDIGLQSRELPDGFDPASSHTLRVVKSGEQVFSFYLDGALFARRTLPLVYGQIGAYANGVDAHFENVTVDDESFGWGDAAGDIAQGLGPADYANLGSGYASGLWDLTAADTLSSRGSGNFWNAIYRNRTEYGDYAVEVQAQASASGQLPAEGGYGLIVSHDDRNNQLTLWIDPSKHAVELVAVVNASYSLQTIATPADFDPSQFHKLAARKSGNLFDFFLDDVQVGEQAFELPSGAPGLAAARTGAHFQGFSVSH